jgi:hypothetical membrane protein
MKKSRIFVTVGAFTLALVGVFATKANKKFASPTNAYLANGTRVFVGSTASDRLTTSTTPGSANLAYIATNTSGVKVQIFSNSNGTGLIYYK